jgi:hypothetical protein
VITTKVKTAIFNDATLQVNEINVETFKGVVQLSSFVRSQADIDQAVQVVRGVAGVKSVKNDMPFDTPSPDYYSPGSRGGCCEQHVGMARSARGFNSGRK